MVDVTSLIQSQSISEVEMEEINSPPSMEEGGDEVRGNTLKQYVNHELRMDHAFFSTSVVCMFLMLYSTAKF